MKLLKVRWSKTEAATYYVDADKFSCAHDRGNEVTLASCGGTYHFNKSNGSVTLETGVEVRTSKVESWELTIDG
nr:MAG TPA: hypothetical protein [Caudoviricetes sp.]